MNYIFTMTLSGSCILLVYMLIRKVLGGRLLERWYYRLLKVVALYFLVPLPFLKGMYMDLYYTWLGTRPYEQGMYYSQDDMIVFINDSFLKFNDTVKVQGAIFAVWILGTILIGMGFAVMYLRRRKVLNDCEMTGVSEDEMQLREQVCKQHDIRSKVEFLNYGKGNSPFTIGFFRPIVFYDYAVPTEEKKMLLAHELIHIKRGDMFWRFASILAVAMHWYNPLAWWFKRELERTCEYSCDEQVVLNEETDFRLRYARILLNYKTDKKGVVLEAGLSKEGRETEKRMRKILERTKKLPTVVAVMIMVLVVALNSLTVFAYEDVKVARGDIFEDGSFEDADFVFVPKGEEVVWENPEYMNNYVYHYDVQFVDAEGDVYEVHEDIATCATCEHEYVEGMVQKHVKNSTGGCRIYYYNALRCSKCGDIKGEEYVTDVGYAVCPH